MATVTTRPTVGMTTTSAGTRPDHITLRSGDREFAVRPDDVDWVEAVGNYVRVHAGHASLLHRATLEATHEALGHDRFIRIRRSTVVRIAAIRSCVPYAKGSYTVLLRNGTRLRSSRTYLRALRALFQAS